MDATNNQEAEAWDGAELLTMPSLATPSQNYLTQNVHHVDVDKSLYKGLQLTRGLAHDI